MTLSKKLTELAGKAADEEQRTWDQIEARVILAHFVESNLPTIIQALEAQEWKPIETLIPQNDMEFIVMNDRGVFSVWWDSGWGMPNDGHKNLRSGWFMVSDGKDHERPLRGGIPTHWRPLPPAPENPHD